MGLNRREARMSAFWRYFAFSVWWAGSLGEPILHCFLWSWACLHLPLHRLKGPKRREVCMSAIWRYSIYSVLVGRYSRSLNSPPFPMSLRPAPTARHSLVLGRSFSVGHGLLGASPLGPLVHISNPSPYTHVKSQFPCSISLDFFFFQTVQIKNTYIFFIGQ